MFRHLVIVGASVAALASCQQAPILSSQQNLAAPSSLDAASPSRPWKASLSFAAARIEWAGAPGVDKSTFGGRCSAPSDYIIHATFEGTATHIGAFTGSGAHCTQIAWTPSGPGAVTYSDGRGTLTAANGDTLDLQWGNGTTGYDPSAGTITFTDQFAFVGGSGRFAGASGGGREGGAFADFNAVLAGSPVPMWMAGTIAYGGGK
jgi:hypothetical protein